MNSRESKLEVSPVGCVIFIVAIAVAVALALVIVGWGLSVFRDFTA